MDALISTLAKTAAASRVKSIEKRAYPYGMGGFGGYGGFGGHMPFGGMGAGYGGYLSNPYIGGSPYGRPMGGGFGGGFGYPGMHMGASPWGSHYSGMDPRFAGAFNQDAMLRRHLMGLYGQQQNPMLGHALNTQGNMLGSALDRNQRLEQRDIGNTATAALTGIGGQGERDYTAEAGKLREEQAKVDADIEQQMKEHQGAISAAIADPYTYNYLKEQALNGKNPMAQQILQRAGHTGAEISKGESGMARMLAFLPQSTGISGRGPEYANAMNAVRQLQELEGRRARLKQERSQQIGDVTGSREDYRKTRQTGTGNIFGQEANQAEMERERINQGQNVINKTQEGVGELPKQVGQEGLRVGSQPPPAAPAAAPKPVAPKPGMQEKPAAYVVRLPVSNEKLAKTAAQAATSPRSTLLARMAKAAADVAFRQQDMVPHTTKSASIVESLLTAKGK